MDSTHLIDRIAQLVPGAVLEAAASIDVPAVYVPADRLVEVCRALRDQAQFDLLIEITAVDYLPRQPRYEVVYHLV